LEVAFDEFLNTLPDHNRARRRERLQARGQADRMPDGSVLGMRVAGLDGSDNHFSAVDAHPNRQRRLPPLAQLVGVTLEIFLHPAGGVQGSLRMILMGDRRSEQRENAIAGGLHDIAVVAMRGVHHEFKRWIDDRAR
jgi:hypothetical protein